MTDHARTLLREALSLSEEERADLISELLVRLEGPVEDDELAVDGAWPDAGVAVPGVPVSLSVRQLPVSRFPYRIADVVAPQELRVLAVAHVRRRPGYWRSRTEP